MRIRRGSPLTAIGLGLLGLVSLATDARAQIRWIETGEYVPAATVVAVPRTYLVPASTTLPTSAYFPTAATANVYFDATTAYVPSSYVTSSYVDSVPVRPGYRAFRPRRFYERAYLATPRTIVPTYTITSGVSSGLVATSAGLCCETPCCAESAAPATSPAPASATKGVPRETRTSVDVDERQPRAIDSSVVGETNNRPLDGGLNSTSGNVDPGPAVAPRTPLPGASLPRDLKSSAVDPLTNEPRSTATETAKPAPQPDPKAAPAPSSTRPLMPGVETPKPAAPRMAVPNPAGVVPLPTPLPDTLGPEPEPTPPTPQSVEPDPTKSKPDLLRRDAMKPVVPSTSAEVRTRTGRNILQGKVVSADTLRDEEGVEVIVSDSSGQYVERTTRTDAFGKFAISLPEGSWTIKLTMPSGRRLAVGRGEIKVASGRIIDMYGRDLTNLVIQR